MLFLIKNKLFPMQILIGIFVLGALWLKEALDLRWYFDVTPEVWTALAVGLIGLAISDGALHGLCVLLFRQAYLTRYQALVEVFRSQTTQEIIVGGVLAGAEELVFRGLILEGLLARLNLEPWPAIVLTAVVFGLCHLIPSPKLWPFAIWAVWEGLLLGVLYIWSESLLVCVVVHALHDTIGFSLFAYQRKTGWLLPRRND